MARFGVHQRLITFLREFAYGCVVGAGVLTSTLRYGGGFASLHLVGASAEANIRNRTSTPASQSHPGAGAIIMAKTWSSKMQHLYTIWLGKHDESYVFTDEDLDSWVPPPEYGPLHESFVGHNRAISIEIQKMRPRRQP